MEKIKIVYAGAATAAQKPDLLIHAVKKLRTQYPELADKLLVEYYCPRSFYFKRHMERLFRGPVQYGGFLPFAEVQKKMMAADILFLSLSDFRYAYAFPAELADYINMEKPILAALPQGFAREVIEKSGLGITVDAGEVEGLCERLVEVIRNPERLESFRRNVIAVKNSFAMKHQVRKLAQRIKFLNSSIPQFSN